MTYVRELRKKWMKDPEFRAEYDALHVEFETINSLIRARMRSGLTQSQIAERMGTSQSAVARLEGGRSNPSMRTLERYAEATGTRVRIWLEPVETDALPVPIKNKTSNQRLERATAADSRKDEESRLVAT